MKEEGSGALKLLGVIMILFGIGYAILGTLSLLGVIIGPLPGHEHGEAVIVTLSYITLIVAILGGIASIKSSLNNVRVIGVIFATIGIISLIYTYLTQRLFNNFDCITIVLGIGIIILATLSKMENEKVKAVREAKRTTPKVNNQTERIQKHQPETTQEAKKEHKPERVRPVKSASRTIKYHDKKPSTTTKKKIPNTKRKSNNTQKKEKSN